jgi:diguanylate cyclase (GGDEF)-like protein/PAS domain S-box-containing protein
MLYDNHNGMKSSDNLSPDNFSVRAETDALISFQSSILEAVAFGSDDKEIIDRVCRLGEGLVPGCLATVMLLDNRGMLNVHSAPSTSPEITIKLNGLCPGPESGSCGNAVYRQEPVFVEDTLNDPRWNGLKKVAEEFRFGSCWSMPVFSEGRIVVGTFALTGFENRMPTSFQRKLMETAASIVAIVLERGKKNVALQRSEERFKQLFEGATDSKMLISDDGRILDVNRIAHERLGYAKSEMIGRLVSDFVTTENIDKVNQRFDRVMHDGHATYESAQLRRDGSIMPVEISTVIIDMDDGKAYYSILRDITERKRVEVALCQSEKRFRDLVETTTDWIWEVDDKWRYVYVSPRVQDLFGYSAGDLIGKTPFDFMPENEIPLRKEQSKSLAENGEAIYQIESRRIHKDGHEVIVETSGLPVFDDAGRLIGYRGITRDISHRKKMELALRENEAHLRDIMQHAPIGLATVSLDGHFMEANQSLCEIVGYTKNELKKLTFQEITYPDDLSSDLGNVKRLLAGEISFYKMEKRYIKKSGDIVWIQLTGSLLRDAAGAPSHFIAQIEDISERKVFEKRLRLERDFSNSILDTAKSMVMVIDREGKIVRLNHEALEFTGYTFDEIKNQPFFWERFLPPEQKGEVRKVFDKLISGDVVARYENFWFRRDGSKRLFDWSNSILRGLDGKVEYLVTVGIDITERKQSETSLQLAASVFSHAREGIMITDAQGSILEVNNTFTLITGYKREEVLGRNPRLLQSGRHEPGFFAAMWQSLINEDFWAGEIWNRRKNGEIYAEMLTISTVRDADGQILNHVSLFTDITELKLYQKQLEYIAHSDMLTGLPNRVLLADRLHQAMSQCLRRDNSLAVIYLDLDGFKAINDGYGHDVGDQLLINISQRMKDVLRECDTLARIGGDEFVAVLADLDKPHDCEPVLARLLQAAADPVKLGDAVLQVSASIGVSFYPKDNVDADQLMRQADHAMYQAKQAGKNRYQLFDTSRER